MSQHLFHGGNNGGVEPFPQQNELNSQFENTHERQKNPGVNINPEKSKSLTPAGQRSKPSNIPVNRGTTNIFYKTRMCQKFVEGNCRNGDSCTFAHGPHDLRQPPPNWQELMKENRGGNVNGNGNWNDDQKIIQRMRICRKFYNGDECPYGDKCNFLHESPSKFKTKAPMETGRTRDTSVINIQTVVDRGQSQFAHGLSEFNTSVKRVEGDGQSHGHSYARGSVAPNSVHGPTTEPLGMGSRTQLHAQQGEPKGFLKLANKKLNRIYGDWIDDEEDELR